MPDAALQRVEEIFYDALDVKDVAERHAFVERTCGGDAELRAAVEEKLASHAEVEDFFKESQLALADPQLLGTIQAAKSSGSIPELPEEDITGKRIGKYKLLQKIGEGGCGVVYMAEQEAPVRRRVALKVIKLGMDTKNVIARFEAERQALAMMEHSNIARVFDAGATETGRPYFVMELVRGVRITTYCDENGLDTQRRLELFCQVCQAVQHAHQKGVIHRDIKPSNIIVTLHDGVPVPKVIDFGIAKATEGRLTDNTIFTAYEQFIGTPAYMSPEQAEMSGLDVDTRSDIYSLGVLLYELLTGRTPFDQQQLISSGIDVMRRTLREKEPQWPSTLLTSLRNTELTRTALHRHVDPPKLISTMKGDLDWIVMKALEKDRRRRYDTANGLAMDVQRYLNQEPVFARPPSRLYRFQKLAQRNKVVFASVTAVAVALILGMGISTVMYLREREAHLEQVRLREVAETARVEAERARANEAKLRREAEAREKVTEATVLVSHGKMQEADAVLEQVPAELFSPSTEATTVFRTLGQWNVVQGRWKPAAARFLVLVKVNQVDKDDRTDAATRDLLMAAPLLVEIGDFEEYDRVRRRELSRLADTSNPIAAEHLIKSSLLLPVDAAVMKQLEPLAVLISDSLKSGDPSINGGPFYGAWRTLALGLLEYRKGNWSAAEQWLQQSLGFRDPLQSHKIIAQVLLGLTHQRLGQADQAVGELGGAQQQIQHFFEAKLKLADSQAGQLQDWIIARLLLREADARSAGVAPGAK